MKNKILRSTLMFVILIFLSLITIDKQTYLNYFHESISRVLSNNGVDIVFASRNNITTSDSDSSFFNTKIESFKLKNTTIPELNLINLEIQPSSLLALSPKIKLTGNILGDGILESDLHSNIKNNSLTGKITLKQIPLSTIDKLKNIGINNGTLDALFSEINFNSNPQNSLSSNFSISARDVQRPTGKSKDIPEIFANFIPEINALNFNFSGNLNLLPSSQKQQSSNINSALQDFKVYLKNITVNSPLVEITAIGEYLGELSNSSSNNKNLVCKNSSLKGNFKLSTLGLEKITPLLPLISKSSLEIGTKQHDFTINGCDFKFEIDSDKVIK